MPGTDGSSRRRSAQAAADPGPVTSHSLESYARGTGRTRHRLLPQVSKRVNPDDLRKDDFGRIVAIAARKLALDLSRRARALYREYAG